jgi:hypothetical protein
MVALTCFPSLGDGKNEPYSGCLTEGIQLQEIVTAPLSDSAANDKKATVKQTLQLLKARCRKGKLVDGTGKEIRFFRLIGCWGNPPDDYEAQLRKQAEELDRLRKKYIVVEISCDQGQDLRKIN